MGFVGLSVVIFVVACLCERVFFFIPFVLLAFRPHSFVALLGRELLLLKFMSAFPVFTRLREESDVELNVGISLIAVSLMAQVDPSSWSRVMMFLFHHEMDINKADVVEYIKRRVVLVIMGSSGCCNCTAVAQCGCV